MKWLRKGRSYGWRDVRTVLAAALFVAAVRLALVLVPYRAVHGLCERLARPRARRARAPEQELRRVLWGVRAVARRLLKDRPCLVQALVVRAWIGRLGYASVLHVGVLKGRKGELLAHAWVERDGEVLIGGRASPHTYTVLRPPHAGAPSRCASH